jgi:hypothetical protein
MTLKSFYGSAEGPLGFPMQDRQAQALDAILKALPREPAYAYRKAIVAKGPSETLMGERSDVSWITTEDPDRQGEVVLARGMNDSQFRLNPIVTMQHAYHMPPVGKSLWRKMTRDGDTRGVKAKTQYPVKPDDWQGTWPADVAFSLVQADLLRGKSIGFLPTKLHAPEQKEIDKNGWTKVDLVIDEWLLLEYACTFLPAQQNAVVEAVSKGTVPLPEEFIKAMEIDPAIFLAPRNSLQEVIPFTALAEVERAVEHRLKPLSDPSFVKHYVQKQIDVARGRI